jgi:DNA-binding transcriptional regulator YiaG
LAIIEITPDYPSPTTTDRLLESIRKHPDGLTVKELSDILNRPVSMIQICLKTSIANRQVTVKQRSYGQKLAKVYILKQTNQPTVGAASSRHVGGASRAEKTLRVGEASPVEKRSENRHLKLASNQSYTGLTPIGLREVAGLTQTQIAAELGLTVRTIDDWEEKRSQPKLVPSQFKHLMLAYQCTLDELVAAFE